VCAIASTTGPMKRLMTPKAMRPPITPAGREDRLRPAADGEPDGFAGHSARTGFEARFRLHDVASSEN
jgi:hypothetical protein